MQSLPELWSKNLQTAGIEFLLNTNYNKLKCETDNGTYECDRVISTIPSIDLSRLVKDTHSNLSELLCSVKYANMAVMTLEFENIKLPVEGFGVLVPTTEPCDVLGITFDSL